MAAFREHVTFSTVLGAGYAGALVYGDVVEWPHAVLGGMLCGVSGMLPDLDSDSGKPVREIFGLVAAVMPMLLIRRLDRFSLDPEQTILVMIGIYIAIRFGASWLFKQFTVHRGMFHSIPAAIIAGEIAYLAFNSPEQIGRYVIAGGVCLGFLSHLLLDEIYSVDMSGLAIRLNNFAGSAMKFASKSVGATVLTWSILGILTYLVGVDRGLIEPVEITWQMPTDTMVR